MIKLENVNKIYKLGDSEAWVLKDINLKIKKGEFVAIIGQSGSGKSTLLNIIACLDDQSSGKYTLQEKDVKKLLSDEKAELRRDKFGFVFQRYNLIPTLTCLDNVALPAIYNEVAQDEREKKAKELLSELGIGDKFNFLPNRLSGGQQQRVSIARALMNGGEIILADEPTGALDSKSGEMVMNILVNLHKKGHTIILVTHDHKIANYAHRNIEIKDGKIISDCTKQSIDTEAQEEKKLKAKAFFGYANKVFQSFKMSINSILFHKMRSLLTMLGIIVGISSVICVVALGEGSQEKIISSIRAVGTNTINIYPGKGFGDMRTVNTLTIEDSQMLSEQTFLEYSTPNNSISGTVTYENKNLSGSLRGGGVDILSVSGIKLDKGRNFTKEDIDQSSPVVIIDENAKREFFRDINPIGKILYFKKIPLKIIGISKQEREDYGVGNAIRMYAPVSTIIDKITGDRKIRSITIRLKDGIDSLLAEKEVTKILTQRHGTKDFFMRNSDAIKQATESTMLTMRIMISSIAFISLIVGGIGVMNIMLVNVSERTKEIGIKMAIGANRSDIMQQFLIEAIVLCIIGGILGLLIAYGFGFIFNQISEDFYMKFSILPALVALITSSFIGIIFGFIPAQNASKLKPIDALLQE